MLSDLSITTFMLLPFTDVGRGYVAIDAPPATTLATTLLLTSAAQMLPAASIATDSMNGRVPAGDQHGLYEGT